MLNAEESDSLYWKVVDVLRELRQVQNQIFRKPNWVSAVKASTN